ncbi:uncharacterized protein LOC119650712 isoform X2 [Hermetia illucens]|nr:uncharacterized protein LOC119650712 isoform X2 [Hermetia illucens]
MGPSIAIMVIVIAFGVLNRKDSESVLRLAIFSFSFIMLVEVAGSFLVTESYSLLYDNMYLLFQNYISNANKISEFQWRFECCGLQSFREYQLRNITLPPSCCSFSADLNEFVCDAKYTYRKGCYEQIEPVAFYASIVKWCIPAFALVLLIPIDLRRGFEEMLGVQRKRVDTTDSETQPLGVQTEKP